MANTEYAPLYVDRHVAQIFCTDLDQILHKQNKTLSWLPIAKHHHAHIDSISVFDTDSVLGLLKFLRNCVHTQNDAPEMETCPTDLGCPGLVCMLYNALRETNWFEHDNFRPFSPCRPWCFSTLSEHAVAESAKLAQQNNDDETIES